MNSDDISRRRAGHTVARAVLDRVKATPRQEAVAALQEAEGKAKRPDKRPFRYAITYRLDKTARSAKGDYDARYDQLIALIETLSARPWHVSTSVWEITSHQTPRALLDILSKPLDVLIDVVTVTQIATTLSFGDAKLKA